MSQKKNKASILVSVFAFFVIFFVFCAFAIDFSFMLATRAKLQNAAEASVLAAASDISENDAEKTARDFFSFYKTNNLENAQISTVTVKRQSNAIQLEAYIPAPTFFLSALGINTITVKAKSAAKITSQTLQPDTDFTLENHISFTSPVMIFAKQGAELKITRDANSGEYLVFIGLDDKTSKTKWVDITCTSNDLTAEEQYFDFNTDCGGENYNGNISVAKYIRVVNNDSAVSSDNFKIDALALINISKLIKNSEFEKL